MNASEVERGDLVARTDQDWGEGMVLSVHIDEARVSWPGVVAWVSLDNLTFATPIKHAETT